MSSWAIPLHFHAKHYIRSCDIFGHEPVSIKDIHLEKLRLPKQKINFFLWFSNTNQIKCQNFISKQVFLYGTKKQRMHNANWNCPRNGKYMGFLTCQPTKEAVWVSIVSFKDPEKNMTFWILFNTAALLEAFEEKNHASSMYIYFWIIFLF